MPDQTSATKPFLNPATVAASVASGAAYAVAYCYELGFTETFRIPRGVVTIALTDFLMAAFWSAVWLTVCWVWIAGAIAMGSRAISRWGKYLWAGVAVGLPLLVVVLLLLSAGYPGPALAMLIGGLLILASGAFDEAAPQASEAVREWPMLAKFREIMDAPLAVLRAVLGRYAPHVLVALALSGAGAFLLGRAQARNPINYVLIEGVTDYVILRTYREHVVLGHFDPKSQTFTAKIRIVSWPDLSDKALYRKNRSDS